MSGSLVLACAAQSLAEPSSSETARVGIVAFAVAFALAPIATLLARRIFPGRNVFFARWGFSRVALVVLIWLAASLVVGALLGAWVPAADPGADPGAGVEPGQLSTLVLGGEAVPVFVLDMIANALAFLAASVAIVVLVRRVSPEGLGALGLRADRMPAALLVGVVGYGLLFQGVLGLGVIWSWFLDAIGHWPGPQPVALEIGRLEAPWFAFGALFAILVIPFFEELVFRGFLQPLMVQNFGDKGGVVLTSAVFASLHGTVGFLPIFGLSLVLGSVMLRTQRLWAPVFVHAIHNALMVAALRYSDGSETLGGLLIW